MRRTPISTGRVVVVSFLVDLLDIVTNLIVAVLTGSAVVFAEMAQGMADSIGSFLLVIGYRRSRRPRDASHPLGYAREVFFWALLSSMIMLFLGSGLSLFRGVQQLSRAEPLERPLLALAVMVLSVATNGYALSQSVRKLRSDGDSLLVAFRRSSRQLVKTALLRDLLGTLSAVVGLVALAFYLTVGSVLFDAIGAMLIGALMCLFAVLLISEARSYIAGQAVSDGVHREILQAALAVHGVEAVNELAAVIAGSEEIDVELDLDLVDHLTTPQVEAVLDAVEAEIGRRVPNVRAVRVDLNPARPPKPDRSPGRG